MRRTAAIVAFAAMSLAAFAAPTAAAGRPWELNRATGREVVIGAGSPYHEAIFVSVPGSPTGAKPSGAKKITAATVGVAKLYGSLDSGDVDGDGDGDLVLGADPLVVIPGGRGGPLLGSAYRVANPRPPSDWETMGHSVHLDDVDRDGYVDAIASHTNWGSYDDYDFAVTVFWGGASKMTAARSTTFELPHTDADAGYDNQETYYRLHLGAGNIGGDSRREIIAVVPGQDNAGEGGIIRGAMVLCRATGREINCGVPRATDPLITEVAVGDFVGDGRTDVILGALRRTGTSGGSVYVYRGTSTGLASRTVVSQATPGVPGSDEDHDFFGSAIAAADLDRNGKHDLAVGAPGEQGYKDKGRVTLLYGHRDGLGRSTKDRTIDQSTSGVPGTSEPGDEFGNDVSLLDIDGNGAADLIVGAAGENEYRGAVTIIRSSKEGRLLPSRSQAMYAATFGIDSLKHPGLGRVIGK